ncbi:MAG: hypothetical protein ACYTEQ_06630 [Planctomycetota bacterium]|jgi:hypothetical protein
MMQFDTSAFKKNDLLWLDSEGELTNVQPPVIDRKETKEETMSNSDLEARFDDVLLRMEAIKILMQTDANPVLVWTIVTEAEKELEAIKSENDEVLLEVEDIVKSLLKLRKK